MDLVEFTHGDLLERNFSLIAAGEDWATVKVTETNEGLGDEVEGEDDEDFTEIRITTSIPRSRKNAFWCLH